MSLNDIKLSAQLTANLYTKHLVVQEATTSKKEVKINFLGKNEKKILILVNKEDCAFLADNELNFLTSVLSACSLSLADVAIINRFNHPETYQHLTEQFSSRNVLLFDVTPEEIDLPVNFPHYQVQHFNKVHYLTAPSLDILSDNKYLKKSFWNALKRMFGI